MPGLNDLFIGFLKIYNKPLVKALAAVATASLIFEYFLTRFRCVKVVILIKLKKTGKALYILEVYRPIILLSSIDKIIKKTVDKRIIIIIKKYKLFS